MIKVESTKFHITNMGRHIDQTLWHYQNWNIKRPTSEVKNHDLLWIIINNLVVKPACSSSSCRLSHKTQNIKTRHFGCVSRGLFLRYIKVCWNCDHCLCYWTSDASFGYFLQFFKHKGRQLLWVKCLVWIKLSYDASSILALCNIILHGIKKSLIILCDFLVSFTNNSLNIVVVVFLCKGKRAHNRVVVAI